MFGQAVTVIREKSSVRRFQVGLYIGALSFFLTLGGVLENYFLDYTDGDMQNLFGIASIVQIMIGCITMYASLSLPRRPEVYKDGMVVDSQNTCSALDRFVFGNFEKI